MSLELVRSRKVPVRWFLSYLAFLNSLSDVVPLGRLHTAAAVPPFPVVTCLHVLGISNSSGSSSEVSGVMVDAGGTCSSRRTPREVNPCDDSFQGRLSSGLGSLSDRSNCLRQLDFGGLSTSHQRVRDEGSDPAILPSLIGKEVCLVTDLFLT